MPKITKQFIETETLPPRTGQRFYRDDDMPGFAIRVTPKTKSFVVEKRVDGVNRRITIAKCNEMSLEAARKKACIVLGELAKRNDPKTGKRVNPRHDVTLREVLEKFLAVRQIRKATQLNYHYNVRLYFKDWMDLPITSITKDMVELRHHELTVGPNRLGTSGHGRANSALKRLSTLIKFASDRFGTDDEPLIKSNPVSRLTRNKAWHRIHPRLGIIPDHKLKDWYRAVSTLKYDVARDFLLFLLFTGMRVGEALSLKWCHIDFEEKLLTVPRELTKSDREHSLPLTEFLMELLKQRRRNNRQSEWVFPSLRDSKKHLSQQHYFLKKVRKRCGVHFTFHDLRRTFLTMAEKLDVPNYTMKRLINHSVANDMTGRYIILDMERLRMQMERISSAFVDLLGATPGDLSEWKRIEAAELSEAHQMVIPLNNVVVK